LKKFLSRNRAPNPRPSGLRRSANFAFYVCQTQGNQAHLQVVRKWSAVIQTRSCDSSVDIVTTLRAGGLTKTGVFPVGPNGLPSNGSGAQAPTLLSNGGGGLVLGVSSRKVKLTVLLHRDFECVQLYLHLPINLHGVVLGEAHGELFC
jgi:hypothetical protein